MKTERELFWKWAQEENPLLVEEAETGSQFHKDMLDHMFMGWVASASREGYKLVPLELVDEIEDKIWDNLSANHTITNQEGDGFIPVEDIDLGGIYKAMIEAVEK